MKHRVLAALVAVALWSGPGSAADMPMPYEPPPAPVPFVPGFTWSGFYVGGNIGYAWTSSDLTYHYGAWTKDYDPDYDSWSGHLPLRGSISRDGWTGGLQAGYNHQIGSLVVGVEADLNYIDGKKSWGSSWQDDADNPGHRVQASASGGLEWLGTLRGRVGYAQDRVLIYATGGLAIGGVKASASLSADCHDSGDGYGGDACSNVDWGDDGDPVASGNDNWWRWASLHADKSETSMGWVLGAGAEYAFTDNWTFKAEYLYYSLGDDSVAMAGDWRYLQIDSKWTAPVIKRDLTGSLARVGINYKF